MESYEVQDLIGKGSYGTVYLCRKKNSNGQEMLVMKKIIMDSTPEDYEATKTEVMVLSSLQHPNVIGYYDNFIEKDMMIIIMEYASQGNLSDYLRRRKQIAPLLEEDVRFLFSQLILGIRHIHSRKILHRDLKPQNVMLDKNSIVKIGDFGISKILSSKSKATTMVSTPCYSSPELWEAKPYDQKSDMWSVGCILYEMLTLQRAFEAQTLPALISKVMRGQFTPVTDQYSEGIREIVNLLLSIDSNKRPSADELFSFPVVCRSMCRLHMDLGMPTNHAK